MANLISTLQSFRERFGQGGRAFAAPARVNLIGEHTDYTGGLVMPMAIAFHTVAAIGPASGSEMVFWSENFHDEARFPSSPEQWKASGRWSDYPLGVVWSLREAGIEVPPFSMVIAGDVPLGAGLSSSASIEIATALAVLAYAGKDLPLEQLAVLCRRAENEFVGAKSGIMDQFIVAGGVADRSMMLDCRSLDFDLLPLPAEARVVICNSMVKHQIAAGEYGSRRDEVEAGQEALRRGNPKIELLRDATLADLEAARDRMSEASFRRCRHIITENGRVLECRDALLAGDLQRFGELMHEAHLSFRDDFQASCAEIDLLVSIAENDPACFGARITGGGFGGCTVNLVRTEAAEQFAESLRAQYREAMGIKAQCFVTEAADGALALAEAAGKEVS